MSDDLNRIDDMLNYDISRSLQKLGFTFPKTIEDFDRLLAIDDQYMVSPPEYIIDPYVFLEKSVSGKNKRRSASKTLEVPQDYSQKFAQAAREGKEITDDIKRKMAADKLNSKRGENRKN